MKFIAQLDKLRMAHLSREKELTGKKKRSLLHAIEFGRMLKEMESNMKTYALYESGNAKASEMKKLRTTHVLPKTVSRR